MSDIQTAGHQTLSQDFNQALSERYLAYALSTIMSRSLPDIRDGLKPVHRRLIYAMHQLKLDPKSGYKKCARIVGDVMGKFHPHGDSAIYETMVRLAQDFSLRYPLVEGQGNFGNIDGDNAAAMRYTEAKLTPLAMELLQGLNEDAVDFKFTYDGESQEPLILPARFPNLLANGSTGIAVGMATSIPPHNLDELCEALIHLIQHSDATIKDLMNFVKGPDFPTGGMIVEDFETIYQIYETGRGSLRLRARYDTEPQKGGITHIVITEIPYMVEKSKLIERIATLLLDKKLPFLEDIRDESTDELRIVIVTKQPNIDMVMAALFKNSDLETRVPVNLNVLDTGPKIMNLKEILQGFLMHRFITLQRQNRHHLEEIHNRLQIITALLKVYINLDEVIQIIREDETPKQTMMQRFDLNDVQAESILNMRLRSLRKIQEIELIKEQDTLLAEQAKITHLLEHESAQKKFLVKDFKDLQKLYGAHTENGKRRTHIDKAPDVVDYQIDIEREDITLVLSVKNWLRCLKGHQDADIKYKEGDEQRFIFKGSTLDKLILFSKSGRFFTIEAHRLSTTRGGGHGDPIRAFIDLPSHDEILNAFLIAAETTFVLLSTAGRGFRVSSQNVLSSTKLGKQVFTTDEEISRCLEQTGDHMAFIGHNRKLLIIPAEDIPLLAKGKGVTCQKYKQGFMSDACIFNLADGLSWMRFSKPHHQKDLSLWLGKRGQSGRIAPIGFPRDNKFGKVVN